MESPSIPLLAHANALTNYSGMVTVVRGYPAVRWGRSGMYTPTAASAPRRNIGMAANVHPSPPAKGVKFSTSNTSACVNRAITGMAGSAAILPAWVGSCGQELPAHVLWGRTTTGRCVYSA